MGLHQTIHIITLLICFFLIGILGSADVAGVSQQTAGSPTAPEPTYADGYVLVQAGSSANGTINTLSEANAAIGATMVRDYSSVGVPGLSLVQLPDQMTVSDAVSYYSAIPGVAYAEPDYYMTIMSDPNDPDFWRQWGLSNTGTPYRENTPPGRAGSDIHALSAWNQTTSTNGSIVAVVDTGVDVKHPDLVDNLWSHEVGGVLVHGYDVLENDYVEPLDDYGHGTHCAGIIGMVGNNGQGGTGVAWNTSVMAVKALNSMGSGKVSDLALGMVYASNLGVPVISCSFGNYYVPSRVMEDIIRSSPALFVCAAGNSHVDTATIPCYPASYNLSNVLAVASSNPDDTLSNFSNYGNQTVHVAAPGYLIYSTVPSTYSYHSFFEDRNLSGQNLTWNGNWTYVPGTMPGELPFLHGEIPQGSLNTSLIIESNQSVMVPENSPFLVWDVKGTVSGKLRIEYSLNGNNWLILQDNQGIFSDKTWTQTFAPLYSVGAGNSIRFRITYFLTGTDTKADVSIRDLRLGYPDAVVTPQYEYMNGTSMATPMVAGMAGMLKGIAPELTASEIKQVIMDSVDPVPDLTGKVISGGRVNLSAAIQSLKKTDAISLQPGWNHVSVPRNLAPGADTARIFVGVNASGHSILMYQNDTAGYRALTATDSITPLQGYWIFAANATTVPVRFAEPVLGASRNLSHGWSSVGGWADEDVSANNTFQSLFTGWSYAVGYHALTQQYDIPIIRGGTGDQSDIRPIHPYQGYWLYCSMNGTYQAGFG